MKKLDKITNIILSDKPALINNDLIDKSPEGKLKRLINAFKKYDSKRNKYYSGKLKELGEYQSIIQELEDLNQIKNLKNIIEENRTLKSEVKNLKKQILELNLLLSPESKNLYKESKDLINEIVKLNNTLKSYKDKLKKSEQDCKAYLNTLIKFQVNEQGRHFKTNQKPF